MHFAYFVVLLGVTAFKSVDCYPNRLPRTSSKDNNKPEDVIPARYKIKNSKSNIDPTIAETIYADFPEVEYPSSISDSTKPFYLNLSPFSKEVESNFKSLVAQGKSKTTPKIVFNWKPSESQKDKNKSSLIKANEMKNITETKNNLNLNGTTDGQEEAAKEHGTTETVKDYEELEYVLEFIGDLDTFLTTITNIETELININNSTANTFDSEPPNESTTITSDMTIPNNETVTELNEHSLHTDTNPSLNNAKESSDEISLSNEAMEDYSYYNSTEYDYDIETSTVNYNDSYIEQ